MDIKIGNRCIGPSHRPFIIAEMSGNHNQSLDRALEIVDAAGRSGADALKIQTYTADTMTLPVSGDEFSIKSNNADWSGKTLHQLYGEAYTPWEWHEPILTRAKEQGMIAFSTPFDNSAVDFLESLDMPLYKIASFENIDIPLIERVAATRKPMIISTGMANAAEIDEAVRAAKGSGCSQLILLKCTSTYPALPDNTNIRTIPHMRELFGCPVGLSDHTMGTGVAVASVALGATVIEKHFTLSRADGGVDSSFSMEPEEMHALVVETERAWQSLGQISYGARGTETDSLNYRRSLYISSDLEEGDILTPENLRTVRPGRGLPPKYLKQVVGMRIARKVNQGTPLSWELFHAQS